MIIAIDGPAGSGKSTIAREVAKQLRLRYLDTGAMYRAITLLAVEAGLVPERISEAGALAAQVRLRVENRPDDLSRVFVGDREVTDEIRGPLVSQHVSAVSADPGVREVLTTQQRDEAASGNVVLEGRDMGTVVVPDADLKVFLTASIEERARRRQLQLQAIGVEQPLDGLVADIARRDALDSQRAVAPLRKAADAVEVDTTGMTIAEVVATVRRLAEEGRSRRRLHAPAGPPADEQPPPEEASMTEPMIERWPISRMVKGPLDTIVYRITHVVLGPIWRFVYRMRVQGVEHFPLTGPVVVVCNHRAMTDPFFLGINGPRQIHYMAKVELWKFKPLAWAMEAYGTFPVVRGGADRAAIKRATEILDAGAVLGLFPEGHVYRGSELGPLRPGISLFSMRDGVVTIPAVLKGTDRVIRHGLPRLPRVELVFGPPLDLPGTEVPKSERGRIVTERVTKALNTLLATPAEDG
jgi:cytidylate kinase